MPRGLALLFLTACGSGPPTVVTIAAANDPDRQSLDAFVDAATSGPWWHAVAPEWGVPDFERFQHVVVPELQGPYGRDELLSVSDRLAGGGDSLVLFFLPPGASVRDIPFEAFHDGRHAVIERGTPFPGGETVLEATTRLASHEIAEALCGSTFGSTPREPWTAPVWQSYEPAGEVEVGDLCEGTRATLGAWEYQRIWSPRAAQAGGDPCLPAVDGPYFNVTATKDWFAPDEEIVLSGWATAPRAPWLLAARVVNASPAAQGAQVSVTSSLGPFAPSEACAPYPRIQDGETARLSVQLPAAAGPGDWAVISVCSYDEDRATCFAPAGADVCHPALVGVFLRPHP